MEKDSFDIGELKIFRWTREEHKQEFVEVVNEIKNDFFKFAQLIDEEIKGLHTEFYELDGDDYGTFEDPIPMIKYMVTFSPLIVEKFTEEWRK